MLEVCNISKAFKRTLSPSREIVLDHVSLNIAKGEFVGITGKSGTGKSTLARIICGSLAPDSGEILLNGQLLVSPVSGFNKTLRRTVQLIPQQPFLALDPRQKIGQALAEPILAHKLAENPQHAEEKVKELLSKVWLHHGIVNRYPSQISGGQAQRVVIARALSLNPCLLVADEATSMLDTSSQAQIVQILRKLRQENGTSVLLISHDLPLVEALCNRVYHLKQSILTQEN